MDATAKNLVSIKALKERDRRARAKANAALSTLASADGGASVTGQVMTLWLWVTGVSCSGPLSPLSITLWCRQIVNPYAVHHPAQY
jgi:hypothetical protein